MKIAHLLAGGYNATAGRIPKTREVCVAAVGRPAEEIDNIDGGSNDPWNLQFLCTECHHAKTRSHLVPASAEQSAFIDNIEKTRVLPEGPAQLCDDERFWDEVHRQRAR